MQEEFKTIVQKDDDIGLYIVIKRSKNFYGNLSIALLKIAGENFKVKPYDLTTDLVICLPQNLTERLNIKAGNEILGVILFQEYKKLTLPSDVKEALEKANADFNELSLPQQRQSLLFIAESKNEEIRQQRINALVAVCSGGKK